MQEAIFGGGCFWCLEAIFEQLHGVKSVISGYSGGKNINPSYEAVCSGQTGHAEVVKIVFEPGVISYRQLLEVFFGIHDPTTLNRQGADVGSQYRSVIFALDAEQFSEAREFIAHLNTDNAFEKPVVTELSELKEFYPAETYHQGYFRNNPSQGYCSVVVSPKVQMSRKKFPSLIKLSD